MRSAGRHRVVRHLATELELSETQLDGWLAMPHFGASWALVSAASPVLARQLVPRSELSHQMQLAGEILGSLAGSHVPIQRTAR
jgi:hypothetical protein